MDEESISLKLTISEVNTILTGLGELKIKDAIELLQKIHKAWADRPQKTEAPKPTTGD